MPHFTIDYSANLDGGIDMAEIVEVARRAAVAARPHRAHGSSRVRRSQN